MLLLTGTYTNKVHVNNYAVHAITDTDIPQHKYSSPSTPPKDSIRVAKCSRIWKYSTGSSVPCSDISEKNSVTRNIMHSIQWYMLSLQK